jgi:hypothetical protein
MVMIDEESRELVEQDARHSQFSYVHNLTPVEREKSPRL